MPALPESANHNINEIAGAATSGSVDVDIVASPQSPSLWATASIYLKTNVDTSGATLTVTYGGVEMTEKAGARTYWDGHKNLLTVFELGFNGLESPPTGSKTVHAAVSGLPSDSGGFWILCDVVVYSGVLSSGDPVVVSGDTAGAQTANSVTVPSVSEAHRVVTVHAIRTPNLFSAHNLSARAITSGVYAYIAYLLSLLGYNFFPYVVSASGGELLVQDAPGASTVTGTCTQPSTAQWAAIGFSLTPAPVVLEAALEIPMETTASLSIHRALTPVAERYWKIPAIPGIMPDGSEAPLAGQFIKAADGIIMPLYIKDPGDVVEYTLDWSNHLPDDDPIVAVSYSVTNSELIIVSSSFTEITTQVILSGCVTGVSYGVTAHATTEHGRQLDRTFRIVGGQN